MLNSQNDYLHHERKILLPILSACAGYMCFAQSQIIGKFLGSDYHFSQIIFFSQISLLLFTVLYGFKTEGMAKCFKTTKLKLMIFRGFIGKAVLFLNFFALPHVELTTFYTIVFTTPLWIIVLSYFVLKDKVAKNKLLAVFAGIGVVAYIFQPWNNDFNWWILVVFGGALCSAIEMITIRHIGKKESRAFMIGIGAVIGMAVITPLMLQHYITPSFDALMLMFGSGVLMALGLFFVAHAYQNVSAAAQVAPYQYTQIVWGALFGYLLFNELPKTETVIGAGIIIAIGIYLMYSDRGYVYKNGKLVSRKIDMTKN